MIKCITMDDGDKTVISVDSYTLTVNNPANISSKSKQISKVNLSLFIYKLFRNKLSSILESTQFRYRTVFVPTIAEISS